MEYIVNLLLYFQFYLYRQSLKIQLNSHLSIAGTSVFSFRIGHRITQSPRVPTWAAVGGRASRHSPQVQRAAWRERVAPGAAGRVDARQVGVVRECAARVAAARERAGRCSRCNGTLRLIRQPRAPPASCPLRRARTRCSGERAPRRQRRTRSCASSAVRWSSWSWCANAQHAPGVEPAEDRGGGSDWDARRGPKSFAFYRIQSIRTLTGASPTVCVCVCVTESTIFDWTLNFWAKLRLSLLELECALSSPLRCALSSTG